MFSIRVLRVLLFVCLISIASGTFAQKEYHKWYFGNKAGIDFTSGTPVALTNSAMDLSDDPGVISDSAGNVLFYCNGLNIWNRNHTVMPNGSGIMGAESGGQTAPVVKKPGCGGTLYYLFTQAGFASTNGLRYTIVDMSLNGGLGDVVTGKKNVLLHARVSEQVLPVQHANGRDVWIISHPWTSSSFNVYLLTDTGLNTTPVVSTVGLARNNANTDFACGQITVNPTNDKLAWAAYGNNSWELFDFDNATGSISNARTFTGYTRAWGIEFSPNGQKVYLTGWTTQYVYQFDISTPTQSAIAASAVSLGNINGPGPGYITGYMQRAPDDKIYMAVYNDTYLAVINNPNATGTACNMVDNGFYLGGKTSSAGLPDKLVVSKRPAIVKLGNDTTLCPGNTLLLDATQTGVTYHWHDNYLGPTFLVTGPGTYHVTVTNAWGCSAKDTITVNYSSQTGNTVNLGNDTAYCSNFSRVLSTGNANTLWSTGVTAAQITVNSAGTYWASVPGSCGNMRDTIQLIQNSPPVFNLGNDTAICTGATVTLNAGAGTTYHWQDNSANPTLTVTGSGTYAVTVTNSSGCSAVDAIQVNVGGGATAQFSISQPSCGLSNGSLTVSGTFNLYEWKQSGNLIGAGPQVTGLGAGVYTFHGVNANGCSVDSSFTLAASGSTVTLTSNPAIICVGDSALVCAPAGYAGYQWNSGESGTRCIYAKLAGNYRVTVTDNGNCTFASSAVAVATYPRPPVSITVNGDTLTVYNAVTKHWYLNGNPINGATDSVYIAPVSGSYTVHITDTNGCHSSSNAVIIVTGIEDITMGKAVVYPNPSAGLFELYIFDYTSSQPLTVSVFDALGRKVYEQKTTTEVTPIHLSGMQTGIYLLRVEGNNLIQTKKIVLQK